MSLNDRVFEIIKKEGMSDAEFARSIKYKPQMISQWKTGEIDVSPKAAVKILEKYPKYSPYWLLFEKGEMLNSAKADRSEEQVKKGDKNLTTCEGMHQTSEPDVKYYNYVDLLAEKDKIIASQAETIETQKAFIKYLQSGQ